MDGAAIELVRQRIAEILYEQYDHIFSKLKLQKAPSKYRWISLLNI